MRYLPLLALFMLAACIATVAVWQRQQTARLRTDLAQLRRQATELVTLQAEHQRLVSAQLPAAERERLRGDHEALARLRAELAALKPSR